MTGSAPRTRLLVRSFAAAVAMIVLLALGVTTANAASVADSASGTITGTVTRESDGRPLAGVPVYAQGASSREATTAVDGTYTITGLAPDTYHVWFDADGTSLVPEYFDGTLDFNSARTVPVRAGETVSGIDASLLSTASITGAVTRESDGKPVAGAQVFAYGPIVAHAEATSDGTYTISGLWPGDYTILFGYDEGNALPRSLVSEYFDGVFDRSDAQQVTVDAGETVSGIDASLVNVGTITGRVTYESDGRPLVGVLVTVSDPMVGPVDTGPDGTYQISGLTPGNYTVTFQPRYGSGLAVEYFDGIHDPNDAREVAVGAGETVSRIDASLVSVGSITGRVTSKSGDKPVAGVLVVAHGPGGGEAYTASDGTYTIKSLSPGRYSIEFWLHGERVYIHDADEWSVIRDVAVGAGQAVSGINGLFVRVGSFTSTMTPEITGDARVGRRLTAEPGAWDPAPQMMEYQWQRNGKPIPGAIGSTYELVAADGGTSITVVVTGSKSAYATETRSSAAVPVKPAAPASFRDVPSGYVFAKEIAWLAGSAITTGWDVGGGKREYRPFAPVLRDQMAAFLYRAAGSPAYTPPATSPFVDVPTNYVFYKEIAWLAHEGISTGWDIGGGRREYRPFQSVSRDVMAAFLYRAAGSPSHSLPWVSPFVDVPTDYVFYKEISWLASAGISTGWIVRGEQEYRSFTPVLRDVMAAFLYRYDRRPR